MLFYLSALIPSRWSIIACRPPFFWKSSILFHIYSGISLCALTAWRAYGKWY